MEKVSRLNKRITFRKLFRQLFSALHHSTTKNAIDIDDTNACYTLHSPMCWCDVLNEALGHNPIYFSIIFIGRIKYPQRMKHYYFIISIPSKASIVEEKWFLLILPETLFDVSINIFLSILRIELCDTEFKIKKQHFLPWKLCACISRSIYYCKKSTWRIPTIWCKIMGGQLCVMLLMLIAFHAWICFTVQKNHWKMNRFCYIHRTAGSLM